MTICYKEINLPVPLTDDSLLYCMNEKYNKINTFRNRSQHYVQTDVSRLLNPELLDIFDSLNLTPEVFHIFGHVNNSNFACLDHLVHSDLMHDVNQNDKLTPVPFAINWELTDTDSTIFWWDVNGATPIFPLELPFIEYDWYRYGRGQHYGQYKRKSVDPETDWGYKQLEVYHPKKNRAFMFNTTVPHSSNWQAGNIDRVGFTLRFPLNQIASWEQGYKIFHQFA
jgi:hypothetical protein